MYLPGSLILHNGKWNYYLSGKTFWQLQDRQKDEFLVDRLCNINLCKCVFFPTRLKKWNEQGLYNNEYCILNVFYILECYVYFMHFFYEFIHRIRKHPQSTRHAISKHDGTTTNCKWSIPLDHLSYMIKYSYNCYLNSYLSSLFKTTRRQLENKWETKCSSTRSTVKMRVTDRSQMIYSLASVTR